MRKEWESLINGVENKIFYLLFNSQLPIFHKSKSPLFLFCKHSALNRVYIWWVGQLFCSLSFSPEIVVLVCWCLNHSLCVGPLLDYTTYCMYIRFMYTVLYILYWINTCIYVCILCMDVARVIFLFTLIFYENIEIYHVVGEWPAE